MTTNIESFVCEKTSIKNLFDRQYFLVWDLLLISEDRSPLMLAISKDKETEQFASLRSVQFVRTLNFTTRPAWSGVVIVKQRVIYLLLAYDSRPFVNNSRRLTLYETNNYCVRSLLMLAIYKDKEIEQFGSLRSDHFALNNHNCINSILWRWVR